MSAPILQDSLTPNSKGKAIAEEAVTKIQKSGIFPDDKQFLIRIAYVESKFGNDAGTYRQGYYGGIWQVDQIGFLDTQNTTAHPSLVTKYKTIKEKFNIEWENVIWKDLTKPLYSALAARLLLSNKPGTIPNTVSDQATYWKNNYNSSQGAGTVQKFINDVKILEG